ncbi:MAG TPA: HD domain-containing phosphohydrolase [Candidatus Micrarchaeaceae archaeon]|nr:HD domain-containing phosphohydrolase [Candidatus Micrarchaeaceae archaeon]
MTNAPDFNIYLLGSFDHAGLEAVLAEFGLKGTRLEDTTTIISPALILLGTGQSAPQGLTDISVAFPSDASPAALRQILHVEMENVVLKQSVRQLEERARQLEEQARRQHRQFEDVIGIGNALSAERDIGKLQELILTKLSQLTNADGASLWLKEVGDDGQTKLRLAWSQNSSIDRNTYQDFKVPVDEKSVVGYTVTVGTSQIYDDAYNPPPGKPQGGKGFDAQYGYRTKSMLTVPMRNYNNEVVGAVQLINAKRNFETKLTVATVPDEVVRFRHEDLEMIESIASQAAVAIDKQTLLDLNQAAFDGFVKASVAAIELRDPATRGHSQNVEKLTTGIALAVMDIAVGKYKDVHFTEDQLKELHYASLLHDFGKVGVRERILIKARKLFPYQLEWIQSRFESIERSVQVKYATEKLDAMRRGGASSAVLADIDRRLEEELAKYANWVQGIVAANEPSVLPEDKASILEALSEQTYLDMTGVEHPMLDPQEFRFLSIRKGTLDDEERREIESHVTHSWEFLSEIKWPPLMRGIPQIAYGHHEKLDGSGYPRGLRGDDIPTQVRMMTISDIYDALTAHDRQYKPAVPVTKALDILTSEAGEGKLDADLLDIFITKRVYEITANR